MNILWCTINRSMRVAAHLFTSLPTELNKLVHIEYITRELTIPAGQYNHDVLSGKIKSKALIDVDAANKFDLIIVDAMFAYSTENWEAITTKKAILIEDQHNKSTKWYIHLANKYKFDLFLIRYKSATLSNPNHKFLQQKNVIWTPHSINPNLFTDYKLPKVNDCILIGVANTQTYPLRHKAEQELATRPYFKRIPRPRETMDKTIKLYPVGLDYAKLLNQTKIVITSTSIHRYPVLKFFEIPGCKAALFSDYTSELSELGFISGENMVELNSNTITTTIEKWLSKSKLNDIIDNGFQLIHSKHTAKIRAAELKLELERYI